MFFVAGSYAFMYGTAAPRCSALIWGAGQMAHLPGFKNGAKQVSYESIIRWTPLYIMQLENRVMGATETT
jgi:hypothetical protein